MASTCGQITLSCEIDSDSGSFKLGRKVGSQKKKLVVKIISCHNLLPKDANGLSDPFVTVKFGGSKHKTKVIKKDLNPVFNQQFTFDLPTSLSLSEVVWITVHDWDRFQKADFIGHRQIPLSEIASMTLNDEMTLDLWPKSFYEATEATTKEFRKIARPRPGSAALTNNQMLALSSAVSFAGAPAHQHSVAGGGSGSNLAGNSSASVPGLLARSYSEAGIHHHHSLPAPASFVMPTAHLPRPPRDQFPETDSFRLAGLILLGLSFNRTDRSLRVHAIGAAEVDAKDKTGLSDPYVEIHLGPNTKPSRGPTDYKTLNPHWNHTFNLVAPPDATMLYLSVYDWDRVGRDLIGVLNIRLLDIHGEKERWFPLNGLGGTASFEFFSPELQTVLDQIDQINRPLRKQLMREQAQAAAATDWHAYCAKYGDLQNAQAALLPRIFCYFFLAYLTIIFMFTV